MVSLNKIRENRQDLRVGQEFRNKREKVLGVESGMGSIKYKKKGGINNRI